MVMAARTVAINHSRGLNLRKKKLIVPLDHVKIQAEFDYQFSSFK